MIVLDFKKGPNTGQRIGLEKDKVVVGNPGCDVVIVDAAVTGPHCALSRQGDVYIIEDLGSASGTRVGDPNRQPLPANKRFQVLPGQAIWIGGTVIEIAVTSLGEVVPTKPKPRSNTAWVKAGATQEIRSVAPPTAPTVPSTPPQSPSTPPRLPSKAPVSAPPRPPSLPTKAPVSAPPKTGMLTDVAATAYAAPGMRISTALAMQVPTTTIDCVVIEALPDDEDPAEVYADYDGQASLDFIDGPHAGRRAFLGSAAMMVGRAESNNIVLLDDRVAVHHCQIVSRDDGEFDIQPLADDRIVRINSEIVEDSATLRNGDIITLGSSDVRFVAAGFEEVFDDDDATATLATQDSVFAFYGTVRRAKSLSIGRAPESDLFLHHHRVERNHARIVFQSRDFFLEDVSAEGVYVNGERISERKLEDGDIADIGGFKIKFDIEALRCGLDLTPPDDGEDEMPQFSADPSAAIQPMYHVAATDDGEPVSSREDPRARKNRKTVLWVEPHDVKRNWRTPVMLAVAVITTCGVTLALAREGGNSFLRRPLSPGHRTGTFEMQVKHKFVGQDACTSCHGAFTGPVGDACITCHTLEKNPLRAGHEKLDPFRSKSCTVCHSEHFQETGAPHLVVGARCATEACHIDRHAKFQPFEPGPIVEKPGLRAVFINRRREFGFDLKADLAYTPETRHDDLHETHLSLPGYCTACHTKENGTPRAEGEAYRGCFTCHGPKDAVAAMASTECSACHREHGEKAGWPEGRMKKGELPAGGATLAVFALLLLPTVLFAFHNLVTAKKRKSLAMDESELEEGPMLCDGVELAKAMRLPRLTSSKCTGSTLCVTACPYGVLEMRPGKPPKPVVAKPELCHECTTCVQICGPGALTMMIPGEPFPMVDRPSVDANYETSVDGSDGGVYVLGEAAAKPSVKNSINLGYWTIEHILYKGDAPNSAAKKGAQHEVVIVGSGPAGLSCGMSAEERGLSYTILEKKDEFAQTIRAYPKGKMLQVNPPLPDNPDAPEPGEVVMNGALWLPRDTTREEALEQWSAQVEALNIQYEKSANSLKFSDGIFHLDTGSGVITALNVVLAPGVRGDPRKLGKPGDDLPKVLYGLDDPKNYEGRNVMIVGGGNSAVEAAIALAEVNERCTVGIVYRKKNFSRATPKNREAIQALIDSGRITAYLENNVAEVRETTVVLDKDDQEVPNDVLFTMLGAHAPTAWMKKMGIELTKKSADWEPGPSDMPAFRQLADDSAPTESMN